MARVVVAGSGFAGLEAVRVLAERGVCERHECIWLSPSGGFVFLPLIPAVAGGRLEPGDVSWSVEGYARRLGVELVRDSLAAVEPGAARLAGGERLAFDYLIVAAGARPAFYGVPGAEEHSIALYGLGSALELRRRVEEGAESVVIVGAGFVGVEVAGELAGLAERLGRSLNITIVDLLPEPLGLLRNPTASRKTREILEEMGATLVLGEPVVKVEPRSVTLKSGRRIEADIVVWSAGFRGPGIEAPKEALARGGFLRVDENLRVPGLGGRVLAAGDAAAIADARGCTALKMAREAIRSGATAAANIAALLAGDGSLEAYRPKLSTCAIQAGLSLGPKRGLLVLGRAVAVESMIPHYYHEHLRKAYQKLLTTAGG